jgi:hypothetical protein
VPLSIAAMSPPAGQTSVKLRVDFVIAPTMQTSAKKYEGLNEVQCIGKMVEFKVESYAKYDIFAIH